MASKTRYIDADKFIKAVTGNIEVPVIRLYDRDWTMSTELPVIVRLRLGKAMSPDEELTLDEEESIMKAVFGEQQFSELLEAGLTPSGVSAILLACLSHYSGSDANQSLSELADAITSEQEKTAEEEKPKRRRSKTATAEEGASPKED